MNKLFASILAIFMAFGIFVGGAVAANNIWITPEVSGSDVLVSGCVIRFSNADGTPSIHANKAHQCAGVESVSIDVNGNLDIQQTVDNVDTNPILFAQCQADETLGGTRGIICGATGGTADTQFVLFDTRLGRSLNLNNYDDRMRVQGKNSNLWVGWIHTSLHGARN